MEELGTIDSETSKHKSANPSNEMKIVVVAPSKTEYKESELSALHQERKTKK